MLIKHLLCAKGHRNEQDRTAILWPSRKHQTPTEGAGGLAGPSLAGRRASRVQRPSAERRPLARRPAHGRPGEAGEALRGRLWPPLSAAFGDGGPQRGPTLLRKRSAPRISLPGPWKSVRPTPQSHSWRKWAVPHGRVAGSPLYLPCPSALPPQQVCEQLLPINFFA